MWLISRSIACGRRVSVWIAGWEMLSWSACKTSSGSSSALSIAVSCPAVIDQRAVVEMTRPKRYPMLGKCIANTAPGLSGFRDGRCTCRALGAHTEKLDPKYRSTKRCLCGCCGGDSEVGEEGLHVDPEGFVVSVGLGPVSGLAAASWAADAGQDRADDLVTQGEQGGDGAGGLRWDVVAARPAGLVDQVFAAELAQVVGRLPDGVVGSSGDGVHFRGEFSDGEPTGRGGQREHGVHGLAGAWFVQVDAADSGGADLRGRG
jgi:hypothetical protein